MNKIHFLFIVAISMLVIACGTSENNNEKSPEALKADSLYKDVMAGHDVGMAKMGKLTRAEQASRRLLDSIKKLPAKARQSAEPIRAKLDSLQKDLSYAEFAMNKWMEEFNMDSAVNNIGQRISYLETEKFKVEKVKEAILGSLQKADSVLKEKF